MNHIRHEQVQGNESYFLRELLKRLVARDVTVYAPTHLAHISQDLSYTAAESMHLFSKLDARTLYSASAQIVQVSDLYLSTRLLARHSDGDPKPFIHEALGARMHACAQQRDCSNIYTSLHPEKCSRVTNVRGPALPLSISMHSSLVLLSGWYTSEPKARHA
eukprot:1158754-Pelagomonas_calceolata.AAC.1